MELETVKAFVLDFLKSTKILFGPNNVKITERLDAAVFPDELGKFEGKRSGLYIISTKGDSIVRYVGISANIEVRIYKHIGGGFTWARNGQKGNFPNCGLAAGRRWQDVDEIRLLKDAEWEVTGVFPDPWQIVGLLESAIIYFGKVKGDRLTINVAP